VSGSSWNLLEENCYVAGGFVRDAFLGAPFRDIDIFVKGDMDQVKEIVQSLQTSLVDYNCETEVFAAGNATHFNPKMPVRETGAFPKNLLKAPIQLVNTSHGRITEVMEDFDYGVNKVAYDLKTGNVIFGSDCELQSLVSTDYGLRDYKHSPKIEDISNGLRIEGMNEMKFKEDCTMEDASDVIRRTGLMITRCSRLGNELGGYGVSFDGAVEQLTSKLLDLTVEFMSKNRGYEEESYNIKDLMNVDHISGGLDIGKDTAYHELTDSQCNAIVKNVLLNRVTSEIRLGESMDY
jgi:hypothetical protein